MMKNDFEKKQLLFVFSQEGQKVSFRNDNICITDANGEIIHQSSCYRIFGVFIIGHTSITTVLIQKSHQFGFPIVLMTPNFRPLDIIGHRTEGNTRLRELQYSYTELGIAKQIVKNKIQNQNAVIGFQRANRTDLKECHDYLESMIDKVDSFDGNLRGLMGIEGNAAKRYFMHNFNNIEWHGRKPRVKTDMVNSVLDIGYTLLFNYVDTMLLMFGFDNYRGVFHREFYLRKSLTCDLVEPFRPLIDWQVRKAFNLGQIKPEHFNIVKGRYLLDIRYNKVYVKFLMRPIMDNRLRIFEYFQAYYRSFMRSLEPNKFPTFIIGD